jgi:hypothetical protein
MRRARLTGLRRRDLGDIAQSAVEDRKRVFLTEAGQLFRRLRTIRSREHTILSKHLPCEHTLATSAGFRQAGREIVGKTTQRLFVGGRKDPKQQKKRHHRGHEVGVGDFPGAAVVTVMFLLVRPLDDDRLFRHQPDPSARIVLVRICSGRLGHD